MWPESFVETDILKILKKTLSQVSELIQQIKVVASKPRNWSSIFQYAEEY